MKTTVDAAFAVSVRVFLLVFFLFFFCCCSHIHIHLLFLLAYHPAAAHESPFDATVKATNRSEVILIALEAVHWNTRPWTKPSHGFSFDYNTNSFLMFFLFILRAICFLCFNKIFNLLSKKEILSFVFRIFSLRNFVILLFIIWA